MTTTFVLTIVLVAALMAAMAIGVIVSNKRLQGSCGGKGGPECACDAQGIPRKCDPENGGTSKRNPPDFVPTSAFGRNRRTSSEDSPGSPQ